jgi:drug/metabolite transporter (DMT)-like permease
LNSLKNKSYFFITILALIWGSSFILMKWALLVYTPYQVGSVRIFTAFLCLLPFVIRHFKTVEKSKWKYLIASGLLGNGIPSILFPLAETRISSAVAGMINSLTPIFTLLVGVSLFGMQVGRNRVLGLIIGLIGAIILISGKSEGTGIGPVNGYALYVVLATICYAFSVNILRYKLASIDSLTNTSLAIFFIGIPMGIFAFSTDFTSRTMHADGALFSLLCIVILGMLSTAYSTLIFNKVIKISGALSAASVTYLIPIIAVIWGVWDHESIGLQHFIGMIAILFGVYMVNRQK